MKLIEKSFGTSFIIYLTILLISGVILISFPVLYLAKEINLMNMIISISIPTIIWGDLIFSRFKIFSLSTENIVRNINRRKIGSTGIISMLVFLLVLNIYKSIFYLNRYYFKKKLYKDVKIWIDEKEKHLRN